VHDPAIEASFTNLKYVSEVLTKEPLELLFRHVDRVLRTIASKCNTILNFDIEQSEDETSNLKVFKLLQSLFDCVRLIFEIGLGEKASETTIKDIYFSFILTKIDPRIEKDLATINTILHASINKILQDITTKSNKTNLYVALVRLLGE
jgi:hypothetical protein